MGILIDYSCEKCDKNYSLKQGCGKLAIFDIDELIHSIRSKKEKELLIELKEKHNGTLKEIPFYEIYECNECHTLHSKQEYQIEYDDNKIHIKTHKCPSCKKELVKLSSKDDIDFEKYKCKKCNEFSLGGIITFNLFD